MRLLVSLLLISALLPGQGACFGHSHAESTEPADHAARPHVHLQGHTHHGHAHHHHGDHPDASEPVPIPGHDDDAVYVSAVDLVPAVRGSGDLPDLNAASPLWVGPPGSVAAVIRLDSQYGLWHGPPGGDSYIAGLQSRFVLRC